MRGTNGRRGNGDGKFRPSEGIFRTLVENSQDAIYVISPGKGFAFVNKAFSRLVGYSAEEICDPSFAFLKIAHPEDRDILIRRAEMSQAGQTPPARFEFRILARDGAVKHLENSVSVLPGRESLILGTARDVTDRKRAEEEAQRMTDRIRKTLGGTINAIALTVEARDPFTSGHQRRVADLARSIATRMKLPQEQVEAVRAAGVLHDLGKIGVPADILSKPSRLTDAEYGLIKVHPRIGYDILKDIDFAWPIATIVHQHHERMDGSGYPLGLSGDGILLESRILAVADVVEAISSHRPYRPSLGLEFALGEISRQAGTLFDARVVQACLELFRAERFSFKAASQGEALAF